MFQLERILVPVDFSEGSLAAATQASVLAGRFRAQVTLLHVNEFLTFHSDTGPLGFGVPSLEAVRGEHLAARQKELDRFAAAELRGIPVKRILCCGDPARVIVERARQERSDLILMPTHGGGAFRRFLLGSVTAKVLHDAECPVWTGVHLEEAAAISPADVRHVICAVNFRPETTKTLRWAAAFAEETGAKLTVTHAVLETPPNLPDRYTYQWHQEAHVGSEQRLRVLLLDSGIRADTFVVSDGDVPNALARAAEDKKAELLVIGRNCPEGATRRLGIHTYNIICQAPCPVVSI